MQGKLTAIGVARMKTPGMYGDGGGLWLQVTGKGAKSWIFRFVDKQIEIIKQEISAAGAQRGHLSAYGLAEWIYQPVNERLQDERLRPLSKTTIWRRIRNFNL